MLCRNGRSATLVHDTSKLDCVRALGGIGCEGPEAKGRADFSNPCDGFPSVCENRKSKRKDFFRGRGRYIFVDA
jgi:hypothetical protein